MTSAAYRLRFGVVAVAVAAAAAVVQRQRIERQKAWTSAEVSMFQSSA